MMVEFRSPKPFQGGGRQLCTAPFGVLVGVPCPVRCCCRRRKENNSRCCCVRAWRRLSWYTLHPRNCAGLLHPRNCTVLLHPRNCARRCPHRGPSTCQLATEGMPELFAHVNFPDGLTALSHQLVLCLFKCSGTDRFARELHLPIPVHGDRSPLDWWGHTVRS